MQMKELIRIAANNYTARIVRVEIKRSPEQRTWGQANFSVMLKFPYPKKTEIDYAKGFRETGLPNFSRTRGRMDLYPARRIRIGLEGREIYPATKVGSLKKHKFQWLHQINVENSEKAGKDNCLC